MARRTLVSSLVVLTAFLAPPAAPATEPGTARNLELVGHDPLFNRGMNAAPAIYGNFVYIGNRTDGSPQHPHPGVLIVDVSRPEDPEVVGEIGPPHEGNVGETSRELRVWPQEGLLIVLNFGCSTLIHACTAGEIQDWNIKFYDVEADPTDPPLVATYEPSRMPHEFFLWVDPADPRRALLYLSTPTRRTTEEDPEAANLIVTDISGVRDGEFGEIATFNANDEFTEEDRRERDVRLHSMAVSADGTRTYLAYLGGGFLVVDSTEVAEGLSNPDLKLITPPENSPRWENQTVHSAVKVPGRDLALTTDEVYGDALDPLVQPRNDFGCPWGWVHLIDISNEAEPVLMGRYRIEENQESYCETAEGRDPTNTFFTSYSAHNPTVLRELALVTWHSGGFQVFRMHPRGTRTSQVGFFSPEPLPFVFTEDPALSLGRNKVVMWSYPILKDGLIYVVDVRNGLYILRYTGPGARSVAGTRFLEGNSNLGDALRLEGVRP